MNDEPVAWMCSVNGETVYIGYEPVDGYMAIPLYTRPSKHLSDEEIKDLAIETNVYLSYEIMNFARAILRKAQET